jgi:mono/diheme cytochrome c family protein
MAGPPPGSPPPTSFSLGITMGVKVDPAKLKPYDRRGVSGRLKAWDPISRKVVWESEPYTNAGPTSGVLATAGNLVFMGNGGGKILSAYDAKSGKKLWSFDAKTAVFAAPITYELEGVQYIAASVGGVVQGADYFAPTHARMLVFALGGKAVLPEPEPYTPPPLNPPPSKASAEVIAHGGDKYTQHCSVCHGVNGFQARSSFPNLTLSPLLWGQEAFDSVVLQGGRQERGMGSFAKELKPEDTVAIREYLISRAQAIKAGGPGAVAGPGAEAPRSSARQPETGHAE